MDIDTNDRIRFSVREGKADVTCKEHPHWHPEVNGDTIADARAKAKKHVESEHQN